MERNSMMINGKPRQAAVDGDTPLLWLVRDVLGMSGTRFGCGMGLCGACTVQVDGQAVRSCITPVASIGTRQQVRTIEALDQTRVGRALQQAWLELDVVQCGYCQSGQLMSASALLTRTPKPSDAQINEAMSGNICRCGTYARIREGIHLAARKLAEGSR